MPCPWPIPTPPACCEDVWNAATPEQQAAALDWATTTLWAATGRRFGLCGITVRPCQPKQCPDDLTWLGGTWSGSTWTPYIVGGNWFNCACPGICSCQPRCQVRLPGPVNSIVLVTVGGIVIPDTAYRVDDQHWLVRTDGECWPECPDMDSDDSDETFVVSYVRGEPVPSSLLFAAGTLACEFIKACTGGDCRLSNRVQSISRSGIDIQMVDPNDLLDAGMTGIFEVDLMIRAYNPSALPYRLRVLTPDLPNPRTVTSP